MMLPSIRAGLTIAEMRTRSALLPALFGRLLPRACLLCESACGDQALCPDCRAAVPGGLTSRCPICALPRPCHDCGGSRPAWRQLIVAADYAPPLDGALIALKFGGRTGLATGLADLLAAAIVRAAAQARAQDEPPLSIDCLVPVPLSARRLADRGFNQASLIAARLAGQLTGTTTATPPPPQARSMIGARPAGHRIAVVHRLVRQIDTIPQSSLSRQARQTNLVGAFEARGRFDRLTVGLVDDIVTTGATLEAAAQALRAAGAAAVIGLAVARTPPPGAP